MPAALSTDLGERVAAVIGGGTTARAAARKWLLARLVLKPDLTMRAMTVELAARGVQVAVTVVR